jgi:hypothetical protein
MKYIPIIKVKMLSIIILTFSAVTLLHASVNVNYTISGKLLRKVQEQITNSGFTITDEVTGLPVTQNPLTTTYDKFYPATFNGVRIKVFKIDSAGTLINDFQNLAPAAINYNSSNGDFSYTMTVAKSRFAYMALVYVDAQNTSTFSVQFNTNDVTGEAPIGSVMPYFGDGNDMTNLEIGGWYLCDGRQINTTNMNQLTQDECNALISILSNAGNPNSNNLPDLRGYFLRGADRGTNRDPNRDSRGGSGNRIGTYQNAEVGPHSHTGSTGGAGGHSHNYADYFFAEANGGNLGYQGAAGVDYDNGPTSNRTGTTTGVGDHTHSISINNSSGSETRPMNVYVNYIIKCRK